MSEENGLKGWMTFTEAAKKYHIDSSTLRKMVKANKFLKHEISLIGKTYLVKESAMERLYPVKSESEMSVSDRIAKAKQKSAARSNPKKNDVSKSIRDKER